MATVYLETTIISYLAAKPSRDVVTAGHQQSTHDWWENERHKFECHISDYVEQEISSGSAYYSQKRLEIVAGINILEATDEIVELAERYAVLLDLPHKAKLDSQHLAAAVTYKMDYLLTWNMKHLAGVRVRKLIDEFNHLHSLYPTVICIPDELMEI